MHETAEQVAFALATLAAILFAIAAYYCIIFLNKIDVDLRHQLTFTDVVNTAVHTSVTVILFALFGAFFSLVSVFTQVSSRSTDKIRILGSILYTALMVILFLPLLPSAWQFLDRTARFGAFLGLVLSLSLFYVMLLRYGAPFRGLRGAITWLSFGPFFVSLPLAFALIAADAQRRAVAIHDCSRPQSLVYERGSSSSLLFREGCPIMFLERGLLFYDRTKEMTFIPWSQVRELEQTELRPSLLD